jgi:hypothetical protein
MRLIVRLGEAGGVRVGIRGGSLRHFISNVFLVVVFCGIYGDRFCVL